MARKQNLKNLPRATSPLLTLVSCSQDEMFSIWKQMFHEQFGHKLDPEVFSAWQEKLDSKMGGTQSAFSHWALVKETISQKRGYPQVRDRIICASCSTFSRRALISWLQNGERKLEEVPCSLLHNLYVRGELRGRGYADRLQDELRKLLSDLSHHEIGKPTGTALSTVDSNNELITNLMSDLTIPPPFLEDETFICGQPPEVKTWRGLHDFAMKHPTNLAKDFLHRFWESWQDHVQILIDMESINREQRKAVQQAAYAKVAHLDQQIQPDYTRFLFFFERNDLKIDEEKTWRIMPAPTKITLQSAVSTENPQLPHAYTVHEPFYEGGHNPLDRTVEQLCTRDRELMRFKMGDSFFPDDSIKVALVPDYTSIQWQHMYEEFLQKALRTPRMNMWMKGSIVHLPDNPMGPGGKVWCIWTRHFNENGTFTLRIIRLVIDVDDDMQAALNNNIEGKNGITRSQAATTEGQAQPSMGQNDSNNDLDNQRSRETMLLRQNQDSSPKTRQEAATEGVPEGWEIRLYMKFQERFFNDSGIPPTDRQLEMMRHASKVQAEANWQARKRQSLISRISLHVENSRPNKAQYVSDVFDAIETVIREALKYARGWSMKEVTIENPTKVVMKVAHRIQPEVELQQCGVNEIPALSWYEPEEPRMEVEWLHDGGYGNIGI